MTDRTRQRDDGTFTIYTPDMGQLRGIEPDDVPAMLEAIADARHLGPCLKCGHLACPCCLGNAKWCDSIDDEGNLCCGGECTFEPSECRRCGFVECACPPLVEISAGEYVAEPPERERWSLASYAPDADPQAPPEGYTPLMFPGCALLPGNDVALTARPQRPMFGPYLLQLTFRDRESGEMMPLSLMRLEIGNDLLQASCSAHGAEAPDQGPTTKACIPLAGPTLFPEIHALVHVRNPGTRLGFVTATLYGRTASWVERCQAELAEWIRTHTRSVPIGDPSKDTQLSGERVMRRSFLQSIGMLPDGIAMPSSSYELDEVPLGIPDVLRVMRERPEAFKP